MQVARQDARALPGFLRLWPRHDPGVFIRLLAVAAALFSLLGFALAAYFRLTFAYPMWVMEVPAIQAVRRITQGQPLYAAPTLDYVAPIYAPVYFVLSAGLAQLVGGPLPALRLTSFAASLGSAVLIGALVLRETRRGWLAVVAAGLFTSTTVLSSFALDLARVDALCLLFMLAAVALEREIRARPNGALWLHVLAGAFTALAAMTKQTALVLAAPLVINAFIGGRTRGGLAYLLGLGLTVGALSALLLALYGQWAQFFLVRLPQNHGLTLAEAGTFWSKKILPAFTIPLALAPVYFIGRFLDRDWPAARFWLLVGAGMVAMAWIATMNVWSADNVLLPAFASLTILCALGLDEVLRRLPDSSRDAVAFGRFAVFLLAAEFVIVQYNPRTSSPLRSEVWAGDRLVAALSALPGRVYGPDYAEYLYMAGKGDQALGLSAVELEGGFGGKPLAQGYAWGDAYADALVQRKFDALVLDPQSVAFFLTETAQDKGYVDIGPLIPPGDEFYRWGSRFTSQPHVWVPRESR